MFGQADTTQFDAALLGADVAAPAPFVLWAIHEPIWLLMSHAGRQWRLGGMGAVIGLDIPALKLIADGLGIEWDKSLIMGLAVFERAACKVMAHE